MNKKNFLRAACFLPAALCAEAQGTSKWTRADCEAYALANAPSIIRQHLARQNAGHNQTAAWDAYLPVIGADTSHISQSSQSSHSSHSSSLSGALPYGLDYAGRVSSASGDDTAWTLEISKRLWGAGSWEGSLASFRNAGLADQAAELLLRRYTRELVETVRQRCHEVIRNRQTHISNGLRLDQARRNLEVAEANQNPLDIANARYEVPQAEAQVLRSERLITDALDRLKETLGLDISFELETDDLLPETHPVLDVAADLAWIVEQSEDILMQELRVLQLQNELQNLRESIGPGVSLAASVGDTFEGSGAGPDRRVTLRASWPIGSVGDRARLAVKENDILDAKIQLRQTQISLHRQVLDYARRLGETERQIDVARQRLDIAVMRVELYKDKWDNGEIDILEYVRAQNAVEDVRIELINQETVYFDLLATYIRLTACDTRGPAD